MSTPSRNKRGRRIQELALELIQELGGRVLPYFYMARQKIEDSNIRKLTRTGGGKSIGVTLPIEYIRELGWKDRQKVVVKKQGQKLVIEDWRG